MELNQNKRSLPSSTSPRLGFFIDLQRKMVAITKKHRSKVIDFFNHFATACRSRGRVSLKLIQRILGLQIWIGTVFRVSRQFLTSTCDVIRKCLGSRSKYFYPHRSRDLASRLRLDMMFWRRFVLQSPQISFDYILGRLPANKNQMFSDASTSVGMGGVLLFHEGPQREKGVDGIF